MIDLLFNGQVMLFTLILFCLVFSLTFHEFGHAIMARFYGDRTAERAGRLSLNPLVHLDPFGLLMVMFIGFGFAKPVPTDPRNYSSRWGVFFVAAAGPLMNLVLAFVAINLYGLGLELNWELFLGTEAGTFFLFLANINLLLMLFNLIPISPLDGHYLVPYFLPRKLAMPYLYYNQRYGHWLLLSLVALAIMGLPIFNQIFNFGQYLLGYLYIW